MSRIFSLPMVLVSRAEVARDENNQPVIGESVTHVTGYFWQTAGVTDASDGSGVTAETVKVAVLSPAVMPTSWDAVRFDGPGGEIEWEIVGPPEPKFLLRRGATLHHWELNCRRAGA